MFRGKEEVTDQLSLKDSTSLQPRRGASKLPYNTPVKVFQRSENSIFGHKTVFSFHFPPSAYTLNALYDDGTHDCALNICKILQVHDIGRRGSRITTDQFPKRAPKTKACVGGGGHDPPGNFLDFNFLKSPFPGFGVIQTGYWPVSLADY